MLTKMLECMVSPLGDHSQMIKAVVFDIGGVLEITPRTGWDQTWADRLSLTRAQLIARLEPVWSRGSRICGVRSSRRCGGRGRPGSREFRGFRSRRLHWLQRVQSPGLSPAAGIFGCEASQRSVSVVRSYVRIPQCGVISTRPFARGHGSSVSK